MFICGLCGKVSKPREKMTKVVISTRKVRYDDGSNGTEIVQEVGACTKCAR